MSRVIHPLSGSSTHPIHVYQLGEETALDDLFLYPSTPSLPTFLPLSVPLALELTTQLRALIL